MKLLKTFFNKILSITLTYKFFAFLGSLYRYAKDYNNISDIFYSQAFYDMLNQYLHIKVKKDWLGRLYGIINPNLDINNKFNISNMIIEIDGEKTNNQEYIINFFAKQLKLLDHLFHTQNLYDYISFDLKHVGPTIADNYLVILDIVSRQIMAQNFKKFILQFLIYCVIFTILICVIL